ncbi:MAG: 16S rRNA (adenine(1518)-N(6)/adenine(1519)-N(6))-dimethyltransferase RsmA [Halobacteriales archaeon]
MRQLPSTRSLMNEAGVEPDTDRDQHFLVDDRVLDRVAERTPDDADHVLEIGGGVGNLTARLARDHEVTAVELDADLAEHLRRRFPEVEVVHGDATDVRLPEFDACVSNLPYSASTPLLFRLLPHGKPLVLLLQREVAERAAATPDDDAYGRLSVTAAYYADVDVVETVPPTAFEPQPRVESAVTEFVPAARPDVDAELHADVVRAAFTQRRKTLRNALANTTHMTDLERDDVDALPERLLRRRPDALSPEDYVEITRALE